MASENLDQMLRDHARREAENSPARHRHHTPDCPPLPLLVAGVTWEKQAHVDTCRYCQFSLRILERLKDPAEMAANLAMLKAPEEFSDEDSLLSDRFFERLDAEFDSGRVPQATGECPSNFFEVVELTEEQKTHMGDCAFCQYVLCTIEQVKREIAAESGPIAAEASPATGTDAN